MDVSKDSQPYSPTLLVHPFAVTHHSPIDPLGILSPFASAFSQQKTERKVQHFAKYHYSR